MDDTANQPAAPWPKAVDRAPREIDVRDLVGEMAEAVIVHAGARYRLRITANNKLILTK
ncbi:hemin uptake protein HemP [Methylocystis sp. 9N]|uniref:Hemin uptake protein HemP n=1 Tax=Methylocystis borbori TaxID=3118750 RepID=A0ABU7XKD5_9HYPH